MADGWHCANLTVTCVARASAEKTRRAYGADVASSRAGAARSLEPRQSTSATLRRYAASLSQASLKARLRWRATSLRCAPSTGCCASTDSWRQPCRAADLPKRPRSLPHVLRPRSSRPARQNRRQPPARAARPGDVRARLRLGPARRGARQAEDRRRSTSTASRCASRARDQRRASCPSASRRLRRSAATWSVRGRRSLTTTIRALLLSKSGRPLSTSDVRRRLRIWSARAGLGAAVHPHALRHSFATHLLGRRRRPARDPGVAGTFEHFDDAGLHSSRVFTLKRAYASSHPRA
jgi:site-specific recombinase XerD